MNLRPKSNPLSRIDPGKGYMRDEKTGIFVRNRRTILVRGMRTARHHRERNMVYKGPIIQPEVE